MVKSNLNGPGKYIFTVLVSRVSHATSDHRDEWCQEVHSSSLWLKNIIFATVYPGNHTQF